MQLKRSSVITASLLVTAFFHSLPNELVSGLSRRFRHTQHLVYFEADPVSTFQLPDVYQDVRTFALGQKLKSTVTLKTCNKTAIIVTNQQRQINSVY